MVHYCYCFTNTTRFLLSCSSFYLWEIILTTIKKAPKISRGTHRMSDVSPFPHGQSSCNHLVIEVMDRCIAAPATPLHRLTARWEFVDARHGTKWQNQKERNKHDVKK